MILFLHFWVGFWLAQPDGVQNAVRLANDSGRVVLLRETESERLRAEISVAPGKPPVLVFRYMDGARKHRFGDMDLTVDDAGH